MVGQPEQRRQEPVWEPCVLLGVVTPWRACGTAQPIERVIAAEQKHTQASTVMDPRVGQGNAQLKIRPKRGAAAFYPEAKMNVRTVNSWLTLLAYCDSYVAMLDEVCQGDGVVFQN